MSNPIVASIYNPANQTEDELISGFVVHTEIFKRLFQEIKSAPMEYPVVASIYNPANQTEDELISGFVVHTEIFKRLFQEIKSAPMQYPEQHYIIQGPRGTGKTTLLLRLKYEIKNHNETCEKIFPIVLNEDNYGVRTLFRLWETVADYLEENDDFNGIYQYLEEIEQDDPVESFQIIARFLKEHKKKLILFIDNIGDLFNKFTNKEHQQFREILLTSPDIRVIGASSVILEHTYDYSKSFFDFFKFEYLEGLDNKETRTLLLSLSNQRNQDNVKQIIEHQKSRVETLRRLTGGIPRSIILLFEIFTDNVNGNSFKDLEAVLDMVTPLYKHRMDDLTAKQQSIVDAIALNWDALATKEIAAKTDMESKVVSSYLRQLEKNQIIRKIETNTKNHLYQISERFFNIWYIMRCGRKKDKKRVVWLVRFLEIWCSQQELIERSKSLIKAYKNGDYYAKHAFYMTEALIGTGMLPEDDQHELIVETRKLLQDKDKKLFQGLSKSNNELFEEVKEFEYYDKEKVYYLKCVQKGEPSAMNNLALLYKQKFQDYDKAKNYYLMAVEKNYPAAMYNLAVLYEEGFKNYDKAEKYYLMALELAKKACKNDRCFENQYTLSCIQLWNNKIKDSINTFSDLLKEVILKDEHHEDIETYLILLIAKKQHHAALKYFQDKSLKFMDRFKPLYYALMFLMKDEFPNEFKKMGNELKETVDEILDRIKQITKDYA